MNRNKKNIFLLVLIFSLGIALGFYLGNGRWQQEGGKNMRVMDTENKSNFTMTKKLDLAKTKLELLKNYTDFILLSPEKNAEIANYADDINNKIETINDPEITARFEDTLVGDDNARSQKVNDFLDFLNDEIKSDLQ